MVGANSIDIVWRQLVNRDKETIATEPRIMTEQPGIRVTFDSDIGRREKSTVADFCDVGVVGVRELMVVKR